MKRSLLIFALLLATTFNAVADKGMWLPSLISSRISDMKSKGFKLSAEDIYSINKASMKDAVVLSMVVVLVKSSLRRVLSLRTTTAATTPSRHSRASSTTTSPTASGL